MAFDYLGLGIIPQSDYLALRNDALRPESLEIGKPYIARLRHDEELRTADEFACDMASEIASVEHFLGYSIVRFIYVRSERAALTEIGGVSLKGLLFNNDFVPSDLANIPDEQEIGYFLKGPDDMGEVPELLSDLIKPAIKRQKSRLSAVE